MESILKDLDTPCRSYESESRTQNKKPFKRKTFFLLFLIGILLLITHTAWADFYVIAAGRPAKRTILVSPKSTATASGAELLNALSNITDATYTNSYLIKVEPGTYDVGTNPLVMKSYVDIEGSGQDRTIIKGSVEGLNTGVIKGANFSEMRFLTVTHEGGGTNAIAIYNSQVSVRMSHITVRASGSTNNYGVYNITTINNAGESLLKDSTVIVFGSGGALAEGIAAYDYTACQIIDVDIIVADGAEAAGITTKNNSNPYISGGTILVYNASTNYGIHNYPSGANVDINNVKITVNGIGTLHYGIHSGNACDVQIRNSRIYSIGDGVYGSSDSSLEPLTLRIYNSWIQGGYKSVETLSHTTVYMGSVLLQGQILKNNPSSNYSCNSCFDQNMTTVTCP